MRRLSASMWVERSLVSSTKRVSFHEFVCISQWLNLYSRPCLVTIPVVKLTHNKQAIGTKGHFQKPL